jgi:hypothetical protein
MKSFATLAAVLAAASTVYAVPSPSEELRPRQSTSLTPVTVKGNGEIRSMDMRKIND